MSQSRSSAAVLWILFLLVPATALGQPFRREDIPRGVSPVYYENYPDVAAGYYNSIFNEYRRGASVGDIARAAPGLRVQMDFDLRGVIVAPEDLELASQRSGLGLSRHGPWITFLDGEYLDIANEVPRSQWRGARFGNHTLHEVLSADDAFLRINDLALTPGEMRHLRENGFARSRAPFVIIHHWNEHARIWEAGIRDLEHFRTSGDLDAFAEGRDKMVLAMPYYRGSRQIVDLVTVPLLQHRRPSRTPIFNGRGFEIPLMVRGRAFSNAMLDSVGPGGLVSMVTDNPIAQGIGDAADLAWEQRQYWGVWAAQGAVAAQAARAVGLRAAPLVARAGLWGVLAAEVTYLGAQGASIGVNVKRYHDNNRAYRRMGGDPSLDTGGRTNTYGYWLTHPGRWTLNPMKWF